MAMKRNGKAGGEGGRKDDSKGKPRKSVWLQRQRQQPMTIKIEEKIEIKEALGRISREKARQGEEQGMTRHCE